jgi:hypothetical protein
MTEHSCNSICNQKKSQVITSLAIFQLQHHLQLENLNCNRTYNWKSYVVNLGYNTIATTTISFATHLQLEQNRLQPHLELENLRCNATIAQSTTQLNGSRSSASHQTKPTTDKR